MKQLLFCTVIVFVLFPLFSESLAQETQQQETQQQKGESPERSDFRQRFRQGNRNARPGRGGGRGRGRTDSNRLLVGEKAPDFKLKSLDGKSQTHLNELRSKKPVVLFFGSYT